MRLFQVSDTQSKKNTPVGGEYFSKKAKAKEVREALNKPLGTLRYVVSPGPDHDKYKA